MLLALIALACGTGESTAPTPVEAPAPAPADEAPTAVEDGSLWAWRDDQADAACMASAAAPTSPSCDWPHTWPGPPHPTEAGFAGVQQSDGQHRPVRLLPGQAPVPIGPPADLVRAVRWSPSGDQLVWEAHTDGVSTVMIGDGTAEGATPLHPHPAGSFEPDLRADGAVVFASSRDGNAELYLANPDLVRLTNDPGDDQRPRFSPDGSRLAWLASRDGNTRIYRATSDGNAQVPVSPADLEALDFAWSPNSSYLAAVLRVPGQPAFLQIFSASNGSTRSVLRPPAHVTGVAWSPDSGQVLLSASTELGSQLYTARVSGRDLAPAPLPAPAVSADPHHPPGPWLPRWSR